MKRNAVLAVLALAFFGLGLYLSSRVDEDSAASSAPESAPVAAPADTPEIRGYVLPEPEALEPFALVDDSGQPFGRDALTGRWSFLYFGYTYCPDVCPLTLVELARLKRELALQGITLPVEYYLVSVDPKRDTPERLREYVAYFDPEFHGLTGSPHALRALAAATDTVFDVPEGQDGDNYLVSHSSNVVVLDPSARVRAVLAPPHEPARMAADFTKVAAFAEASR